MRASGAARDHDAGLEGAPRRRDGEIDVGGVARGDRAEGLAGRRVDVLEDRPDAAGRYSPSMKAWFGMATRPALSR